MSIDPKTKCDIIANLQAAKGDDLYRAKHAFSCLSESAMDQQYGQSGMTPRQILEGYKKHEDKIDGLIEAVRQA